MSTATAQATPGTVNSSSAQRAFPKPRLFIVGAPKCGTSAMCSYLAAHPQVYMARKEMHFFGSDLRFGRQFYRRDREAYLAEFKGWAGQLWAGEASVWYLLSKLAARELHDFNPDARIIVMLRSPTEMLYSLYHQFRFDGNEPLPSFEGALDAEEARAAGHGSGRQTYLAQGLAYRQVARYAEQVQRYLEAFGSDHVHIILYDDFAGDVAQVFHETLEFLDLDASLGPREFKVVNGNKSVRHSSLRALMHDPLVRSAAIAIRPWLPPSLFAVLQHIDSRLRRSNTRLETRPPLSEAIRCRLQREFAPEVRKLGDLLGRDLSHWTQ